MELKCECGGKIVFEKKKTFVNPDQKRGVCLTCHKQFILENGKLKHKGNK